MATIREIPKIKIKVHFLEIKKTKINKAVAFLMIKTSKIIVFFNKIITKHSKVKIILGDNSKTKPLFSAIITTQTLSLTTKTKILLLTIKTILEVVIHFLTSSNQIITNKVFGTITKTIPILFSIIIKTILILFSTIINNLT